VDKAEHQEEHNSPGTFLGFALLSKTDWNKKKLIKDLKHKWQIDASEDDEKSDDTLIFLIDDMIAAVAFLPAPIPYDEATEAAKTNYMWPDAVNAAKAHKAQLLVSVIGKEDNLLKSAELHTKLLSCCCGQKNTTGIYTGNVVLEPKYYEDFAALIKDGELPVFNWIWFGLYRGDNGLCCYTSGMNAFGKDEMEILDANAQPSELLNFISGITDYVLKCDVTLNEGETIGFSEDDKHLITRSEGAAIPGMTLKIEY